MPALSTRQSLLHREFRARVPLYRIPLTAKHRRLRLQWAHEHRAWQAYWPQVVFSYESRFNLWDHNGRISVRRYTGERCLPECVIDRHSGLTPIWGAILYRRQSNMLQSEGNLNCNRYFHEVLQPGFVSFLQGIPGDIFQQNNARLHVLKTDRDFCLTQHMQLFPCPAYSLDMLPIEHVLDLVGWRLARDPCPAASKDELLLLIQTKWN
ncbi:transposable element Tcb2 transposase [Trichonephila clavipes]|nr:transposable element Tcb2 transposase [Trichonephila clavipes]